MYTNIYSKNTKNLIKEDSTSETANEQQSYGVKLTTRPLTSIANRLGPTPSLPREQNVIKEQPWTLSNMLERYSFKETYPWTTTIVSHTSIASLLLPQDLIVNELSAAPFNSFIFWRGQIEVDIQVMGTPFHQGKLMATFFPLLSVAQAEAQLFNFASCMVNPTLHLFPNSNSSGKMIIPFNSIQKYIDLTNANIAEINYLGSLLIYVMNPLQLAAGASDTVTVSVFSRFTDNEFKVPRQTASSSVFIRRVRQDYVHDGELCHVAIPQSLDIPSLANNLKHVVASTISDITDGILPEEVISDGLTAIAGFLDKPTDPNIHNAVRPYVSNRFNFSTGAELIDKLTLDPNGLALSDQHTFGTNFDEMDFNYLKKIESYLGSFTISTSNTIGQVLASFPINPIPINFTANFENQVPLISYLSFPFNYWQGGLTYRFEVVATSLQTAKIFIAQSFDTFTVPSSLLINSATSQYGQAFEINQGTNSITMTVPWVSSTDYKFIPNKNTYSSSNSSGYINIVLLNQLVTPSNTPTEIFVNVYISAAEDFQVSSLTLANQVIPAVPQSSEVTAPLALNDTTINASEDKLVAPSGDSTPRDTTMQIPINHIQRLLKKYQMVGQAEFISSSPYYSVSFFSLKNIFSVGASSLLTSASPTAQIFSYGLMSHYAALYRQFKGPLRFKILTDFTSIGSIDSNYTVSVYYQPPLDTTSPIENLTDNILNTANLLYPTPITTPTNSIPFSSYSRQPVAVTSGSTYRILEFEIPYSSRFNSVYLNHDHENPSDPHSTLSDLGFIYIVTPTTATPNFNFQVYSSFGDESRFGTLCQIPTVNNINYWESGSSYLSVPPDVYSTTPANTNTLTVL